MQTIHQLLVADKLLHILLLSIGVVSFWLFGKLVCLIGFAPPEPQTDFEHCIRLYFLQQLELFVGPLESFDHPDQSLVFLLAFFQEPGVGGFLH